MIVSQPFLFASLEAGSAQGTVPLCSCRLPGAAVYESHLQITLISLFLLIFVYGFLGYIGYAMTAVAGNELPAFLPGQFTFPGIKNRSLEIDGGTAAVFAEADIVSQIPPSGGTTVLFLQAAYAAVFFPSGIFDGAEGTFPGSGLPDRIRTIRMYPFPGHSGQIPFQLSFPCIVASSGRLGTPFFLLGRFPAIFRQLHARIRSRRGKGRRKIVEGCIRLIRDQTTGAEDGWTAAVFTSAGKADVPMAAGQTRMAHGIPATDAEQSVRIRIRIAAVKAADQP